MAARRVVPLDDCRHARVAAVLPDEARAIGRVVATALPRAARPADSRLGGYVGGVQGERRRAPRR